MIYGGINYFYFTGGGEGEKKGDKNGKKWIDYGGIINVGLFGIIFRIYYCSDRMIKVMSYVCDILFFFL